MQENLINKIGHRVYYYETDKMGRVYHANFLGWMEEARTEYLRGRGITYAELEKQGILMPVSEISIKYFNPVEYDEFVQIVITTIFLSRVKVEFKYEFYNNEMKIKFGEAVSTNVFADESGKIKRIGKELYILLGGE